MKSVLALSFHPAFTPPMSGGEERLYYVLNGFSHYEHVTLISFTFHGVDRVETVYHSPCFKEIRIPKGMVSLALHGLIQKFTTIKECSGVVTSLESRINPAFRRIVREELPRHDIIFFESPFLFTIPGRLLRNHTLVYNAYNNEYELMKSAFSGSFIGKILLSYVAYTERGLARACKLLFVVSRDDAESLARTYGIDPGKCIVAPNGICPACYDRVFQERAHMKTSPVCLFIGSYHPPNIEAVIQIVNIAAKMPGVLFLIAGNVSRYFASRDSQTEPCERDAYTLSGELYKNFQKGGGNPQIDRICEFIREHREGEEPLRRFSHSRNVLLLGQLSEERKLELFHLTGIALNPMTTGSGTNIKVLGYLAAGLPTITTPKGARGLDLVDRHHALICDLNDFPEKIHELLNDPGLVEILRENGRILVEREYDWNTIVERMRRTL
ncbi:glycosyltransferase involved in cell wall biosynthesis [Methanolinea mesophila]|uniref:glycosyltransferase family 4 protein n=1 Tax=Methanolinea mesophila TaxID=547055 RepID=UPI001AE1C3B4|nr:glycosyltransferase family 4 protein [Methanolinea mesophila]MBP1928318.1 glycosyltransferase involved in cell wall biosynthesis [Methanolinea mesophila]